MDDLISRKGIVDTVCEGISCNECSFNEIDGESGCLLAYRIDQLPSAQKTGHWIDKTRGEQKNSECSECHTLFRVLFHDYPYCPVCGSRNRGEEE